MAGTGGTTTYNPMSVLTGTTLLPKTTAAVVKPAATTQPATSTKKTTTTLSEMMGGSPSGSATKTTSKPAAPKAAAPTLTQMMGGSSASAAKAAPKAPTPTQKQAINSLAGLNLAAPTAPAAPQQQSKAAIANAFMQAMAAAAPKGLGVPDPKGLTADEANKYRSQFYTNYYAGKPVEQIVEPMDMAQASLAYDINKRMDPALEASLNDPFGNRPAPTYPPAWGLLGADRPQSLGPVAPSYGPGVNTIGMPQMQYVAPGTDPYGRGIDAIGMPQMNYVAPGNQRVTFTPQAVRPGVPAGMPAAPAPAAPAGGGYDTDMLNAKGIARYLLQDMMGRQQPATVITARQQAPGFDPMSLLIGQAKADEFNPAMVNDTSMEDALIRQGIVPGIPMAEQKLAPVPYPRPVTSAETTMPLTDVYDAMNKSISPFDRIGAGIAGIKIPGSPTELNDVIQQQLAGLGTYDPNTGRVVIPNATSREAQAALAAMQAQPKMGDILQPYIDAAVRTRTPVPTDRAVPLDMTRPVPATVPTRPAAPSVPVAEVPSYVSGPGATKANADYAAQQRAGIDALLAGGQAAADTAVPANRQGQYGALDDLLSGRQFQQWTAEGEAQKAKRLAEGVDPTNLYDNLLWSMGLYQPTKGAPSPVPPAPAPVRVGNEERLSPGQPLEFKDPNAVAQMDPIGVAPSFADVLSKAGITKTGSAANPTYWNSVGDVINTGTGLSASSGETMVGAGPEGDGSYMSTADTSPAPTAASSGVSDVTKYGKTTSGADKFVVPQGQILGTNGYLYEVTGTDAQGKPTYKQVGKVPGYTDAQLYKAANRGAFRDPNNVAEGGTTPKPPSAIRTWARAQLDKYNAEVAKNKAAAEAKGETYNPVSFMDYLSLAGSAATGNVAGLLMKGGQMMYPQIIEWLASGPSSTGDSDGTMMDGSPSSSSSSKKSKKKKDDEDEDTDGGTGGTGGTGTGTGPTGGSLQTGYTMSNFPYLRPYLTPVFPGAGYRPGIDTEWNYYPGSERAYAAGGAVEVPRYVVGPGGPKDDKIPARIDGVHEARLSNGEFVITAEAVKGLGGGDPVKGAEELTKLNNMFSSRPTPRVNVEKVR
jgi:hypothetical protein